MKKIMKVNIHFGQFQRIGFEFDGKKYEIDTEKFLNDYAKEVMKQ